MKNTKCFSCQNASTCRWALFGIPVPGWKAKETIVRHSKDCVGKSYLVIECPEYVFDARSLNSVRDLKPWSHHEIRILIDNYGKIACRKIANALGRSEIQVTQKAKELKRRGELCHSEKCVR